MKLWLLKYNPMTYESAPETVAICTSKENAEKALKLLLKEHKKEALEMAQHWLSDDAKMGGDLDDGNQETADMYFEEAQSIDFIKPDENGRYVWDNDFKCAWIEEFDKLDTYDGETLVEA